MRRMKQWKRATATLSSQIKCILFFRIYERIPNWRKSLC